MHICQSGRRNGILRLAEAGCKASLKQCAMSSRSGVLAIRELRWMRGSSSRPTGESPPTFWSRMMRARLGSGVEGAELPTSNLRSKKMLVEARTSRLVSRTHYGGFAL